MRTRQLVLSASVVALLLAACGGDDGGTAAGLTSTTEDHAGEKFEKVGEAIGDGGDDAADDAEAPEGCDVDSGDADALGVLLPESPSGYERQADITGDTGPSDLDKAARDDGSDDAEAVLTEAGFLAGYQGYWKTDADEELIAFVYEFCDDDGAQHYLDSTDAISEDDEGVRTFTPDGLPGGVGQSIVTDEVAGAQVVVVHDHHLVMAQASSSGPAQASPYEARATDLAKTIVSGIDAG